MAQVERVTMNDLVFRLETEITKLSTALALKARETPRSVTVNKEYLARIQSEIHQYHYAIDALSKKQEAKQSTECNDILRNIEDMFFALHSGYMKTITGTKRKISTASRYGKVLKNGYLIKQGHVRKSWKKRLFILTADGFLRYYDSKQRLLNEIDLSSAQFLSVETEHSHFKKPFVFTVQVPGREFIFAAGTENIRKSWIAAIQKAMLKKSTSFSSSDVNTQRQNSNKKYEILYTLTKLEWKQLQDGETLADLQEELEDIADVQLIASSNKLKITATSDSWVLRHIVIENENDERNHENTYIDWDEMIQKVKQFFKKSHGDVIMSGWLVKKVKFNQWRKRWVVLKKDFKIDYYITTKTDKKRGTINLGNVKGVREIFVGQYDMNHVEQDHMFEIENTHRTVKFACASKQELNVWLNAVQENCKYIKTERTNADDSDGDEPLYAAKRTRKNMIDPIIV